MALWIAAGAVADVTSQTSPSPQCRPLGNDGKVTDEVRAALASAGPDELVRVIVVLRERADLRTPPGLARAERLERVIRALQAQAEASQRSLRPLLNSLEAGGRVDHITYFWVFNGFSVSGSAEAIGELARRPEVLQIALDQTIEVPDVPREHAQVIVSAHEPNIALINAPALWALGFRGQGVVVANICLLYTSPSPRD